MPRTKKTALWVENGLLGVLALATGFYNVLQAQNARQTVFLPEPTHYQNPAEERLYKFLRARMTDSQGGVCTNLMPTRANVVGQFEKLPEAPTRPSEYGTRCWTPCVW